MELTKVKRVAWFKLKQLLKKREVKNRFLKVYKDVLVIVFYVKTNEKVGIRLILNFVIFVVEEEVYEQQSEVSKRNVKTQDGLDCLISKSRE